jgi:hypothetical protein
LETVVEKRVGMIVTAGAEVGSLCDKSVRAAEDIHQSVGLQK